LGIDGVIAFFDKWDDALLVDDDVGAPEPTRSPSLFFCRVVGFEDAVRLEHLAVHVAEEREG